MANQKHNFSNIEFFLPNKNGTRIRTVFCRNKKFIYSSPHKLCEPSTFEEIFNHLLPYFNNYVEEYKNYKINGVSITNSIFKMILFYSQDQRAIDYRHGKILYEIEVDNMSKNKIIYEYKNTPLF